MTTERAITERLGAAVVARRDLSGGCCFAVTRLDLADGRQVVLKQGRSAVAGHLQIEAAMLRDLAAHSPLPVPDVLDGGADWLALAYIDHERSGAGGDAAQAHAGRLFATLHSAAVPPALLSRDGQPPGTFGYAYDTVIGQLPQANPPSDDWIGFFRDQRLLAMARSALAEGVLPTTTMAAIERLADRLDAFLAPPDAPALLHGDAWGGNLLSAKGRMVGVIDPAVYIGHPEIELAFGTLFGTFGARFFAAYGEQRPIAPGFFELRRDLYNLYPLLVHVRLFGRGYLAPIEATLRRLVG